MRWSQDATVARGALRKRAIFSVALDWIGISNEGHRRWKKPWLWRWEPLRSGYTCINTTPHAVTVPATAGGAGPGRMLLDADFALNLKR